MQWRGVFRFGWLVFFLICYGQTFPSSPLWPSAGFATYMGWAFGDLLAEGSEYRCPRWQRISLMFAPFFLMLVWALVSMMYPTTLGGNVLLASGAIYSMWNALVQLTIEYRIRAEDEAHTANEGSLPPK